MGELSKERSVVLGSLPQQGSRKLEVLKLLYYYRHLDGQGLDDLPSTDLVTHRIRLALDAKPVSNRYQKRWPPRQEYWLKKLVSLGIQSGIYQPSLAISEHLSTWNARAVLVDKGDNPLPTDEPRLTFDDLHVQEVRPEV